MTNIKLCTVCETYPVHPNYGGCCSQVCLTIATRLDLQFTPQDKRKAIALSKHALLNNDKK